MNTVFLNMENNYSNPVGPQVVKVASWRRSLGLLPTEGSMIFQEKFSNFHGALVNVTALPFAPFWEEQKGPDNITLYSGTDFHTLAAIANALNFTPYVVPTTSWAEVARLVSERVSFMSPVYHNIMPQRLKRYDFSFVYEYGSLDFSMAPPGLQPQWKSLYYPLVDIVWAAILLALLLIPGILVMIIRGTDVRTQCDSTSRLASGAVYQDMMGMLLGQNLPRRLPTTSSSRILVGTWLMFALVIGLAYRGNLTASLTLPKYPPRPETLSQLVDTVDRITMQPYGVEFRNFFAKSDSPVFQKLARLIAFVPTIEIGQNEAVEKK
ncbi:hypothetical protein O3P69_004342 [Scylla paramamosain]|uniref:Ionotropic glutamate receptor C-terminal domain-containing protein n=1 Tax=Scylla paramamosain TaxID=85552 RepID=A0AAW0UFQ5_SCYPA